MKAQISGFNCPESTVTLAVVKLVAGLYCRDHPRRRPEFGNRLAFTQE